MVVSPGDVGLNASLQHKDGARGRDEGNPHTAATKAVSGGPQLMWNSQHILKSSAARCPYSILNDTSDFFLLELILGQF